MVIGTFIIERIVPEYQEASVPLSIISVLAAGPIEEILFFGLPFYVLGHHLIVLAGGIVWVMLHILNTDTLELRHSFLCQLVICITLTFLQSKNVD